MFLVGAIVNTLAIALGATIGTWIHRIPERLRKTVMQGMGLFVVALGFSMALGATQDALYMVASLVIGGVIGAAVDIEGKLDAFGRLVERKVGKQGTGVAEGFVFASLVFCVGSMAILGSIQSGMSGQNSILYTKSLLDGFSALIFASTMGVGVALSAIPILIYEGGIATLAHVFGAHLQSVTIISDVSAVGGLLIVGIGLNVLEIKRILVGNLLPAMVVVAILRWISLHSF